MFTGNFTGCEEFLYFGSDFAFQGQISNTGQNFILFNRVKGGVALLPRPERGLRGGEQGGPICSQGFLRVFPLSILHCHLGCGPEIKLTVFFVFFYVYLGSLGKQSVG